MDRKTRFSDVTNAYLCQYYEILDEMVHKMTGIEPESSISGNFIRQMIPHHEAAIEMSRNILQYTTLIPLQNIAGSILSEQTQNIAQMQTVLPICEGVNNTRQELYLYQKNDLRITRSMFREMQNARESNDINADFLREMIPHHEGAIRMSENALRFRTCPQLVPILQEIIRFQTSGIQKMQRLLSRLTHD